MVRNVPFITEWIADLRSGQYKQVRRTLKNYSGYCCLGRACDVAATMGMGTWEDENDDSTYFCYGGEEEDVVIPQPLLDWIGISNDEQEILFQMNDIEKKTFPEIAEYIEKVILTS